MKKSFLVPLTLCASLTCQANDYYFKPVFSTKELYYSNIRLQQNPPQDNWVSSLSPGVNFGLRHENGELKSNFTWNQLFYTNESKLNVSEQLFSMGYQHNTGRLQWGTNGYYNHQSYLSAEGTVLGGDNLKQIMAKQLSLAPTVSYSLTELSSLSLSYSYNKTTYDQSLNRYLTNYDYHQASGTFTHLYTERDKLNATLSGSRYSSTGKPLELIPERTTYNYVAQLGWQHSFSEQLITNLSAGLNYSQADSQRFDPQLFQTTLFGFLTVLYDPKTKTYYPITTPQRYEIVNTSKTGFGSVYQASIQKTFERSSFSLVGSQNQTPTSQGLQTQTQLTLNTAYNINERWTSGLSGNYSRYEVTGQQNSLFNRNYFFISPNLNWQWTPEIRVGLSYTFRQQEYQNGTQNNTQPSQDNNVQLQISYQPQTNYQVK